MTAGDICTGSLVCFLLLLLLLLLLLSAGYGKNLLSQGIQFLPLGLVQPPHSHGSKMEGRGGVAGRAQDSTAQQQEAVAERIKLDKSNIILLGPTGCGKCPMGMVRD